MKLLITGSNGFLGSNFVSSYKSKYEVLTLSRTNADICVDLSKDNIAEKIKVDIVIHAAAKAHIIPKKESEKIEFYQVNVDGTINLLKSLEGVKTFIFMSSVAVYGLETGNNIKETHSLNGNTPYADSKIIGEKIVTDWSKSNNINLLILRLPLLAGKKPPGNLGTMINAIKNKRYFSINMGKAKRSVVLVEDVVNWLPNQFEKSGIYNLTDNDNPSFRELELTIAKQLGMNKPISIPLFIAKFFGFMGSLFKMSFINQLKVNKMTKDLTFSCEKATDDLSWKPKKVKEHFKIN